MECRFFVGQRVVCVNDDPNLRPGFDGDLSGLKQGEVYSVRAVSLPPRIWAEHYPHCPEPWVYVSEIYRGNRWHNIEIGYCHTRFRPATDISDLERLLNIVPSPELEHA
jgi:hypothetical protein